MNLKSRAGESPRAQQADPSVCWPPARTCADVLKLAHHGSRTSSSEGFLAAVDPAVAIVSAPERSRFGMPHPGVLERVRRAGASLWWTGRDGAVFVALDTPLWVRGFREP